MTEIKKMSCSQLVRDESLHPRASVDQVHVRRLSDALETGADLPPIIACKSSLRVVDGFHRIEATVHAGGDDALISVELREYDSELAIYMDAVELNARHGKPLGPGDLSRITIRARELGARMEVLAALLAIRPEVLQSRVRTAIVGRGRNRHEIALKACLAHLRGQEVTESQAQFNSSSLGLAQASLLTELLGVIRTDSLDLGNARVASLAAELHEELAAVLFVVA